jgi:protein-tyrosine phosphatase
MNLITENVNKWHRRLCEVAPWLFISGDLNPKRELALIQLNEWVKAGITYIIDVRGEWSDEMLVKAEAPQIHYHYLGTHDDGVAQDEAWFRAGIQAMEAAFLNPNPKLLVHCHMGINRGPSMAFAMMLADGWSPIEALDAIRVARPIAGIIYAEDALRSAHKSRQLTSEQESTEVSEVQSWFESNSIDIDTIIRQIRSAS